MFVANTSANLFQVVTESEEGVQGIIYKFLLIKILLLLLNSMCTILLYFILPILPLPVCVTDLLT